MASAHITVEQFEEVVRRLEKIESQYSKLEKFNEKVLEVEFQNKEIKTEFTAEFKIINQKFDSLNDSVNQRFDSLAREISAMWRIQIPIFVAILVMMFRLFGVI